MNELGITSSPQQESEVERGSDEERREQDEEAAANAAVSELCKMGHVTAKEVGFVEEAQKNLDAVAELVVCCVKGKTPEAGLLDACATSVLSSSEVLLEEDCENFCEAVDKLRLDVRHLRSYITKKFASELTEQCYVQ